MVQCETGHTAMGEAPQSKESKDMNRLQLATLLSWAEDQRIEGRKRLQKIVYFLQCAGCPLDCHYTLHHFGPYSCDVADTCDEMVAAGLIEESGGPSLAAPYSYKLPPTTRDLLTNTIDERVQKYMKFGKGLIEENLWSLELGSTILYFYSQTNEWDCALTKACEYKHTTPELAASQAALRLAKQTQARTCIL